MKRASIAVLTLFVVAFAQAAAQVPAPASHFGFEIGADRKLANWTQLTAYYEELAKSSPRVSVDTLGRAEKGQPFVMLTITSEQNHARLDELRDIQMRLSDPRRVTGGDAELQRLFEQGRTVVLITHGIHATEVGSGQTAARLAYRLASSNDPRILEILDNVILLDIPSLNPDGLQWVADWYNQTVGGPFEGSSQPWLYQFYTGHDNNRDWYAFTQSETRLTVEQAHNAWHPHIVHDIHQMGNSGARIFFPPFIDPFEPNVDPAIIAGLNQLGAYMAAELTAQGKAGVVISGIYDGFTPARAYQHYHGGVRILSETASAELATPIQQTSEDIRGGRGYDATTASWNYPLPWEGGTWGLPQIVDYMEAGALALLTNAAKNRRFWLENFYRINDRAVNGWPEWPEAWVIPANQQNGIGLSYVLNILTTGAVEVHRAESQFTAAGRTFPAGSYVIPMQQPYASFAQTMLEVQHYPDLREYPGGPPRRPYDVTAHTLPLLMNVEAVEIEEWDAKPTLSAPIPVEPRRFAIPVALAGRDAPRIAYYKSWQEPMEGGWTRWVFDQFKLRYDTIHDARIRAGNLSRDYDVLLLQSQSPNSIRTGYEPGSMPDPYTGGIGDAGATAIREFVEGGGRLIAIEEATEFAIELFGLGLRNAVDDLPSREFYVPGSIVKLDVTGGHPLTAGVGSTISGWYWDSSRAFDIAADAPIRVLARYAQGNPVQSGWILGPEKLAGKVALAEATVGQGSVVLFGFQPNYRAQTVATWPLLFNALSIAR
ncbi:MAG: M14 family zinc carboxypeptidase [Longimicrobiales bacterium]